MEKYITKDPDKILKKVTNTPIMAKMAFCVSIIFLLMCIYGIVASFHDGYSVIFIIAGGVLFITFFFIYYFQSRRVKSNIKNVDLEKVRKDIMEGVIENDVCKTYFTRNYMLANFYYGFIVEYKDILWIYKRTTYDPNTLLENHDLVVCDKYGKKYYTLYNDDFLDIIVKNNKNVLVGKEHKNEYKELLKKN